MFVEVTNCGSFSACARKLGKVQSAISHGIASLELDLDTQLFDRSTRKPSLTMAGQRLLPYANAILQQSLEFQSIVESEKKGVESLIRLALDNALATPKLNSILAQFHERFPTSCLEIIERPSPEIINLIKCDQANIGLMLCDIPFNKDVELSFIGELPFYAVCSKVHPLSKEKSISAHQLIQQKQIMARGETEKTSEVLPIVSTNIWWTNSFLTIKSLVLEGVGWAYLPTHMVDKLIEKGELTNLNMTFDTKTWNTPIDIVTKKNLTKGPALKWLSQSLKDLLD